MSGPFDGLGRNDNGWNCRFFLKNSVRICRIAKMSELWVSHLNRGNVLAIVLNSVLCISLLVKQLFVFHCNKNAADNFFASVQFNLELSQNDMLNNNKSVAKTMWF